VKRRNPRGWETCRAQKRYEEEGGGKGPSESVVKVRLIVNCFSLTKLIRLDGSKGGGGVSIGNRRREREKKRQGAPIALHKPGERDNRILWGGTYTTKGGGSTTMKTSPRKRRRIEST